MDIQTAARVLENGGPAVTWRTSMPCAPVDVPPLVDAAGNITLGGTDGNLYCFAPDGSQKWKAPLNAPLRHPPTRDEEGNFYVASEMTVQAISAEGRPLWSGKATWTLAGPPAVVNGKVYVGTTAGEVLEFDSRGRCKDRGRPWKAPIPLFVAPGPKDSLIVMRKSGDMMVYHPSSWVLRKRLSRPLPGMVNRPPTLAPNGKLYVSCMAPGMKYSLAAVDTQTGELEVLARFADYQPISPPGLSHAGNLTLAVAGEGIRVYRPDGTLETCLEVNTDKDMIPWTGAFPRAASAAPGSVLVTGQDTGTVALSKNGSFEPVTLSPTGLTPPATTPEGHYVLASHDGDLINLDPDPEPDLALVEPRGPSIEVDEEQRLVRIGPIVLPVRR